MKLRLGTQNMTVLSFCEEMGNTDESLKISLFNANNANFIVKGCELYTKFV